MSTTKTLITVNVITSAGLLIGLVNNSIIAYLFGLSADLDSYFVALIIPMMFMSLFIDFVGKNFLPVYSEEIGRDYQSASIFASTVINSVIISSVLMTALLILVSSTLFSIIVPGFSADQINVSVNMFLIICPAIILKSTSTFFGYILQYNDKYIKIAITSILSSFVSLLVMILLSSKYAEYTLAIGYTAGQLLSFFFLLINIPHKHSLRFDFKSASFQRILRNTGIVAGSGLITRIKPVILRYYVSMLEPGSISAYSMAQKVCSPIHQTSTIGVKMMSFSKSSKLYANGKTKELGVFYTNVICGVLFFIIPLTTWLGVCSDEIVTVLFHRGEFNEAMHSFVLLAIYGLLPSIILQSICPLMSNGFYVINKISIPSILGPVDTLVYIISMIYFIDSYKLLGVSLAHSFVFTIRFIVLSFFLGKFVETFSSHQVYLKFVSYTFVSIVIFALIYHSISFISLPLLRVATVLLVGLPIYVFIFYIKNDKYFKYILRVARG